MILQAADKVGLDEKPSRKQARELLETVGVPKERVPEAINALNLNTAEGRGSFARRIRANEDIQEIESQIREWAEDPADADTDGTIPFGKQQNEVDPEVENEILQDRERNETERIAAEKDAAFEQMEAEKDPESSEALYERQRAARRYKNTEGAEQLQRDVNEGRRQARKDAARRGAETRRRKQKELEQAFEEGRGAEALAEQDAPKPKEPSKKDPKEGQLSLFTGEPESDTETDDSAAYEAALRRADGIRQAEQRIEARRQRLEE